MLYTNAVVRSTIAYRCPCPAHFAHARASRSIWPYRAAEQNIRYTSRILGRRAPVASHPAQVAMGSVTGITASPASDYTGAAFLSQIYARGFKADAVSCHPCAGNLGPTVAISLHRDDRFGLHIMHALRDRFRSARHAVAAAMARPRLPRVALWEGRSLLQSDCAHARERDAADALTPWCVTCRRKALVLLPRAGR